MRLETGMLVKTNYGQFTYRIVSIRRNCTCPNPGTVVDLWAAGRQPPPTAEHVHLVCKAVAHATCMPLATEDTSDFYLNGYSEKDLKSVWSEKDYIEVLGSDTPVQSTFF